MDQNTTEKVKMSPKDFFLHISIIVTLYASATALLVLLFQLINSFLADLLYPSYDLYSGTIRFAIASLIIVFPLFIFLNWLSRKSYEKEPAKRELGIRKFLVYLTLFISGAFIAGDLIAVLYTFLGGEITMRFVLKVLSVLVVMALAFGYYLYDLRRDSTEKNTTVWTFQMIATALVVIAIILGFVSAGSPMRQRDLRFDQTRVNNLQQIQSQIVNYWQLKGELPLNLSALEDSLSYESIPQDPETNSAYMYTVKSDTSFELCAGFNLEDSGKTTSSYYEPMSGKTNDNWAHSAEQSCFERTIDPELYPKRLAQ